jgi:hypothetical protein
MCFMLFLSATFYFYPKKKLFWCTTLHCALSKSSFLRESAHMCGLLSRFARRSYWFFAHKNSAARANYRILAAVLRHCGTWKSRMWSVWEKQHGALCESMRIICRRECQQKCQNRVIDFGRHAILLEISKMSKSYYLWLCYSDVKFLHSTRGL